MTFVTRKETVIFTPNFNRSLEVLFRLTQKRRTASRVCRGKQRSDIESLEPRTLLSVAASAQLNLVSTTGTQANPVYHYDITVTNTGDTNVGTFWFSWLPGEDFLPSRPTATANPAGWSNTITGSNNSSDGSAIEWVATSNAITPSHSLSGFSFTSTDSPSDLAANSTRYSGMAVLQSVVYSGGAFSDAGFPLVVASPAPALAASSTAVVSSSPSITAGAPVTLTATVTGAGATPTGTVTFLEDGTAVGSMTLAGDGTAALQTSSLPTGSLSITALYNGDSTYSTSTSSAITLVVSPPVNAVATTTAVISSSPSAAFGATVTFTATVTPATPGIVPTGTVTFTQNGAALGSVAVQSDGTAALVSSTLPVGAASVVATYNGDATYGASTSAPITQTITTPPTLVPTILKSSLPSAVVAGTAVHGAVTLSIANQTAANVKGATTLALYASTTGAIDGSSVRLDQIVHTLNVKTTKPATVSLHIKLLPGTLPAGAYTLFARVVDASANVNDSAAGPALTAAAAFIALTPTVLKSTLPASATASAKAHAVVSLSLANGGNIATSGSTTATLFATTNGVIDGSSTQIMGVTKPLRIKPGKASHLNIPVKQIPALAPGSYTVIAQVTDSNQQITSVVVGALVING